MRAQKTLNSLCDAVDNAILDFHDSEKLQILKFLKEEIENRIEILESEED